ncbi:MAG: tetratricopeptide repeat protein [Phycisphaerales bacterium]
MDASQFETIRAIFVAAREASDEERPALLDRLCGGDPELRHEVEALLRAEGSSILDRPIVDGLFERNGGDSDELRTVGQYLLLDRVGEGGMGIVYRARQRRPNREVAVKILKPEFAVASMLRRFRYEAELLGRLRHPNIAQIYEADVLGSKRGALPYIAMELVDGKRLDAFIREHDLDAEACLELIAAICDGVSHAHQSGVVHRDLKPANILITEDGLPKILDFGVAKATRADLELTMQTEVGQVIGTMAYMSPEQAGDSTAVDTRSDIYSIGAIAYEALTGRLPHNLAGRPLVDAFRIIRETDAAPISTLNPSFRGDLEVIISTAIARDPGARYQSAAQLGSDIRRFLDDEPISAQPLTTFYQLRKFAKRNRGLVIASGAALIILIAGAAFSTMFAVREARRSDELANKVRQLEDATEFQLSMLGELTPHALGDSFRSQLVDSVGLTEGSDEWERTLGAIDFTAAAREVIVDQLRDAVENIDARFAEAPETRARLLQAAALSFLRYELHDEALALTERSLALRRATLGADDQETLYSLTAMGVVLQSMGRLSDSEIYYRDSYERQRRSLGSNHKDTLTTLNGLGGVIAEQRRYEEAADLLRRALEGFEATAQPTDTHLLGPMINYSYVLSRAGRFDEAVEYQRRACAFSEAEFGADHHQTVGAFGALADRLYFAGRFDDAAEVMRRSLDGHRRVFGADHLRTIDAMRFLAEILHAGGRPDDAAAMAREGLRALERSSAEDAGIRRALEQALAASNQPRPTSVPASEEPPKSDG